MLLQDQKDVGTAAEKKNDWWGRGMREDYELVNDQEKRKSHYLLFSY